eukprot:8276663-Prorocentrum_lima.AAC.1
MFFDKCQTDKPQKKMAWTIFYRESTPPLVDWIHLVQDQEGEFTIPSTLCGLPVRQQHTESFDE